MFSARALLMIVRRDLEESFMDLLQRSEVSSTFSFPGEGTAGEGLLSLLGLEATDKAVILSVVSLRKAKVLLAEMVSSMGINLPGCGIAMTLPLSSIGSQRALKYLVGDLQDKDSEVDTLNEKQNYPYDLIIAIAQRGSSELVMSAARSAGAGGGTIVHAKGTASLSTAKFFGISIGSEKELILIATRHEQKDAIMHAIMEKAGAETEARSVVFTLPVEDVVGLRSIMEANPSNP